VNGMANRGGSGRAFPVEDFVQSLTAQLDRAQDALALKVRTGRPLTFAIKDLSIDLRVFWETDAAGRVLVRHAGPNEEGASTVHLAFTSITRAMVEENTLSFSLDEDPRGLEELAGTQNLNEHDRHRLEMIGVRTVGQLKRFSAETSPKSVETYVGIPVMRLQAALEQAAKPSLMSTEVIGRGERRLLRIRGANLSADSKAEVFLSGEPVEVLEASDRELLVRPMSHHREGPLEVLVGGARATGFYELPAGMRAPDELRRPLASVQPLSAAPASNGAEA
jgi:hypothetical protein